MLRPSSDAAQDHENLHNFRSSIPGVVYFVTCCTVERRVGLADPALQSLLHETLAGFAKSGDADTLAATVMPDHAHWLFELGSRLSLGRVLARFKTETRAQLSSQKLEWQRDFFEHGLRSQESCEDYGLYIFLNPYRAKLLDPAAIWSGWFCANPDRLDFVHQLNPDATPPPEWIGMPVPGALVVGE